MGQVKVIKAKSQKDQNRVAIHLLNPTQSEIDDAMERAERDLFPAIVLHTVATWPSRDAAYYVSQLQNLKRGEYARSIKVWDGEGSHTNQMDLNVNSIPVLIEFLKAELKRIKKAA